MKRIVVCSVLSTAIAPLPLMAEDVAVVSADHNASELAAAVERGDVRLIYLETPLTSLTDAPVSARSRTQKPPQRPIIAVAESCSWDNREAGVRQSRLALGGTNVWVVEPAAQTCAPGDLRATFDAAAELPQVDRLSYLLSNGLTLSEVAIASPDATANGGMSTGFGGQLVISSLPAGTSLGGVAPMLISAAEPEIEESAATAANGTEATSPQPAVRALSSGRPGQTEPAVVVGELASLLAADKRSPTGVPREVRDRIREIDPTFFMTLLEIGNFDPEQSQYIAAIQTELSGMNCYRGSIDGDWGAGSLAAVDRYYSELGETQQAETPGPALYREIVVYPSVTCPTPVVAAPAPTPTATPRNTGAGSRSNSGTSSGQRKQAAATRAAATAPPAPAAPAPAAAPTTAAPGRIDPSLATGMGGIGIIK